ncbi:hypothetical protein [Thalassovita aquimarina]|uniref:Uncharacterized protein n=1 Tax=Thalassovita aquimarina TaxID=2785917 RepID=A0ABS5HR92_9RHOB|nr:hypothetical protein [Thalassovita aquimarina]MBR9651497.1 hypothetical protein [Thalassovita aquimarina]
MSGGRTGPRRILVGAGCFADARAALRLLERLEGPHMAEIHGVLVEETAISGAAMPCQRVVTIAGALTVVPSAQQLRRQFESDARAFRRMLSEIAGSGKWSFEQREGELIGHLREAARGWDMLLVGHRKTQPLTGRVILIAPPAGASPQAADFAAELADVLGAPVQRLAVTPEDDADHASAAALLERLGRIPAAAVVIDLPAGGLARPDRLQAVIDAARCPTFVLGPDGNGADSGEG